MSAVGLSAERQTRRAGVTDLCAVSVCRPVALTPDRSVAHSYRAARVQGLDSVTFGLDEDEVKKREKPDTSMFPMLKGLSMSCATVCVVSCP